MQNSFISLETTTSDPVLMGETRIWLTSQALRITVPFIKNGGLIWNRPVSVTAQTGTQAEQVVPVVDVTRIAQLMLFVCSLLMGMMVMRAARRRA